MATRETLYMKDTLDYIAKKFNLAFEEKSPLPIEIPNYGRNQLAQLFAQLGFKTGAEIGILTGEFSEVLVRDNPHIKLYCIDPWQAYDDYKDEKHQKAFDTYYQAAKDRLAPYNCQIIRKYSLDAAKDFPDQSLDFVYIDGNHNLQNVINDIAVWSKKIRVGGIISGHDYKLSKPSIKIHVYQAVNAYTDAYEVRPWFVLGSYSKKPGTIRDLSRSWMWAKN